MSDYFFYDMNKKMADLANRQQLAEDAQAAPVKPASSALRSQLNERDLGKHNNATTGFAALAKKTGGGEKGARIAGAQLAKMRAKGQVEEDGNQAGPYSSSIPDTKNYKTPNMDKQFATSQSLDKMAGQGYSAKNFPRAGAGAMANDAKGQNKYVDRTAPGVVNKIKDKLGYDMPDPAYGPKPDETQRLAKRYPAPTDESAFQAAIGKKKYGDQGMKALQKAGRNHASNSTMNKIRNQYDKYDEGMTDEGNAFSGAVAKAKADGVQPGEKVRVGGKQYPLKQEGVMDVVKKVGNVAGAVGGAIAPGVKNAVKTGMALNAVGALESSKGGIPQTPKQKAFAKLAPPVDKITFADRIVGAKKEVDEVLGDVAANAMKKAVQGRKNDMEESFWDDEPNSRKSSTGGRIDTTRAGVTRHHAGKSYSGAGHDAGADDAPRSGQAGRRTVGAGMGKKIGAKINTGKSKLMTREGDMDPADQGEYDQEGSMAKDDIKTVVRHAQALEKILGDNDNLPEWVQAKLAKIEGMMTAVDDYMQNQQGDDVGSDDMKMDEESTDKRDSRAEKAGKKVTRDIEYDEKKKDGIHGKRRDSEDSKAERAGKKVAKDIEYDEKKDKKKKEVDETTSSGSVATGSAAPKSGGGMSYGKGIYDSMNREVEKMISESMSINMSMNNDSHGGPSNTLTVTATDEDALQLAMLLKSAGLGSQEHNDMSAIHNMDNDMSAIHDMDHDHGDETCPACGSSECECDSVDEAYGDTDATQNEPDWPTNQEGTDDAMMYSGGLDGPKSTGQTTIPIVGGQDDRMGYAGTDALRRMMEMAGLSEAAATPQDVPKKDPLTKPAAKASAPKPATTKPPVKLATPQAVDEPVSKVKESLLIQLRNFKY